MFKNSPPIVVFKSLEDVQRWADANGGAPALEELVARKADHFSIGDFNSVPLAKIWLIATQRAAADRQTARMLEMQERATVAAEQAAASAKLSARWAWASAVIALAALLISVWPHIAALFD